MSSVEAKFTVQGELGLHARPAGRFVTLAGGFESEIWVAREGDEEWVSGNSVLSILSALDRGWIVKVLVFEYSYS